MQIGLSANDEERGIEGKPVEPGEIRVVAVHDVEGAGLGHQQVEHVDVVRLAVGNMHERWDVAAQVHRRVQLHGALGRAKLRPGRNGQAEIDRGRVECADGVVEFDAETVVHMELAVSVNQHLGEVGVNVAIPRPVGVSQGIA